MATPEDMKANAEFIRMADQIVDVPGGSNNNNYANVTLICEIAQRLRVDAVMPMWGHASENPALPNSLLKLPHKVTFIGPPAAPMHALGDKIGSTIIAQSAGVPVIAWNGENLRIDYKSVGMPQEVYDQADVTSEETALQCCDNIGYPVMIKASEGGGGKGIRKVTRREDVITSYRQVQGEIPGSPIFIMKMASAARHLEVQLLADKYGEAIALSGRDCSVQRRHQKIIEEGPPIAAPANVFKKMEQAAVALAKTVGYCNAGTVEYLFMDDTHDFAFLELNPRLQVEHPVTENILGINLPSCQLQVAMGIPLHRIADIRRLYGRHPKGKDTIDFEFSERVVPPRHCIAVRITAENPDASFQPTSGQIKELQFRSAIDVWGYFSINNSGSIHEFADSQFGHVFASGTTRENARRAMLVALKELQIRGDIRTTVEYIIKLMQATDFISNNIHTQWLDGRIAIHKELAVEENKKYCPPATLIATCGTALQGFKHFQQCGLDFINMLNVGQTGSMDILSPKVTIELIYENIKYRANLTQSGPGSVIVECNGTRQHVHLRLLADGGYLLNVEGKSHVVYSTNETGGSLRMILDGHTCIFTPEYDPTRLTSSVAGKLARLLVSDESHVNAGDPYVEIEVMKMYMPLKAPEAGYISFQMSEGATLSPGDVIALMKLDNPDKVVKAELFTDSLIQSKTDVDDVGKFKYLHLPVNSPPHLIMREALRTLDIVFDGYLVSESAIEEAYNAYMDTAADKLLPVYELEEAMSVLRGRIDSALFSKISSCNMAFKSKILESGNNTDLEFPSGTILMYLHEFSSQLSSDKRVVFNNSTAALWNIAEQYLYSTEVRVLSAFLRFIEEYLNVEKLFDNMSYTDVVSQLRKDHSSNLDKVLGLCRSHTNLKAKNLLMVKIMEEMKSLPILAAISRPKGCPPGIPLRNEINIRNLKVRLSDIAKLRQTSYSRVSFVANLVLIKQFSMKPEARRQRFHDTVTAALTSGENVGKGDRVTIIKKFCDSNIVVRDLLVDALRQDNEYQIAALEIYLMKTYQATHILSNLVSGKTLSGLNDGTHSPWIKFDFMTRQVEAVTESMPEKPKHRLSYSDLGELVKSSSSDGDLSSSPSAKGHKRTPSQELRHPVVQGNRIGVIAAIDSLNDLSGNFQMVSGKIPLASNDASLDINAIHLVVVNGPDVSEDETSAEISRFISTQSDDLNRRGVRRVTFFVGHKDQRIGIYTFRNKLNFSVEDRLFRHIEAPHAFHLDLPRLSNFSVSLDTAQTSSGNVFLYKAIPISGKGLVRYFSRLVSFTADIASCDAESLFVEALDYLGLVIGQQEASGTKVATVSHAANHIFLSIIAPDAIVQPDHFMNELSRICNKYWYKMVRLAVSTVEVKLSCKLTADAEPMYVRLVATNPTGFVLKIEQYYEANIDGKKVFKSIGSEPGSWDNMEIQTPHPLTQKFEQQRAEAMASSDTLYAYDWPVLFRHATENSWARFSKERKNMVNIPPSEKLFTCVELVLCKDNEPLPKGWSAKDGETAVLRPYAREPGLNDAGMVVWLGTFCTPECPDGREVVIICNDITHQAGSFGTKEDLIFYKASEYARLRGLPRLFLAANSGARIGMAQSLKSLFQVCWTDANDPSKGFKYVYLTKTAYNELLQKYNGDINSLPVICSHVTVPGEEDRYMITDIIGEEPDLGVENLMGSGLIAGETSRAYDEIFTLTLVVGRTVGIGAYLVRLGQRTIQKKTNCPIILTGYQALNKLMGREIYTTNDQLGGPMIMFPNGVSHLLSETHMESVNTALHWLSFVPAKKGGKLPICDISAVDTIDRYVTFAPTKLTYDPRLLLTGVGLGENEDLVPWQSGFFDKNSFVEALGGWAKTVVVGRGRLGGIPMGVIVTENRTSEALKPADPADSTSREKMVQQAGGVWFPDSAYKTAQALRDFNREGIPCIIFANWRGFSGGQRDMFDEVLKFGSMIVDALVAYKQPLFVYIPPFAELRGGAWVVVDSTINADVMEFYAAEDARGGVLEAAGAASIKFRDRDIVATAHRIDPVLIDLDKKLNEATSVDSKKAVEKQIATREKMLFGVYQQVAVHFADLHDTPGRMKNKGVIKKQVNWAESRTFFYWRLKRRLMEFDIVNNAIASHKLKPGDRKAMIADIHNFFTANGGRPEVWDDDRRAFSWYEENNNIITKFIKSKKLTAISSQICESISSLSNNVDDIKAVLSGLTEEQKSVLLKSLQ